MQRPLDGTHHHVSGEHLERYLAEFDFRYTTCKQTDTERMERIVRADRGSQADLPAGGLSAPEAQGWLGRLLRFVRSARDVTSVYG